MITRWSGLAALVVLALPGTAGATWSIVAVDPQTQQVGVAVASCVGAPFGSTVLPQVAGVVPGIGALAAQAYFEQGLRDQAVERLASGLSPSEVIDAVVSIDGNSALRQYGVVTLDGATATFTGDGCDPWAGGLEADGVTVQGNILYGPEVADEALAAFLAAPLACPDTLADRLMRALEAGAAQGGDNRCSMDQAALAAVLIVADADDDIEAPMLDLRIESQPQGGEDPVDLLREAYDVWRLRNPPDATGCDGGSSTSGGSATGVDTTDGVESGSGEGGTSTSTSGATASGTATTDAPTTGATATTSSSSSDADTSSGSGAAAGSESGCGCNHAASPALWLLAPLVVRRRRR